ncbi:outer membrane protein assembly factor BamE [Cochlodiniinecator piscidefendens]|uniref:outer membrane protein assembly factor BamE n=1 Tax=Cochlodiniinecator piscidefendens TaxID=2715756 RepID=UPI00140C2428|nr:outer membrane protein assembly factor BamE [Cochlodiniinecator piscidefendens]
MIVGRNHWKKGVVLAAVLALASCTSTYRNHGYVPLDEDLDNVIIGVDTQDSVAESIGRPTAAGILAGSGWYYVQSRWQHLAWRAPVEIEREVLAVSFDSDGVVQNIERFGLEDGNVVVLSRRVTDSNIEGVSFLQQLLGNFGVLDASQFLN